MKYYLDQSIRIEQTNQDTVIGLADEKGKSSFVLVIPAKVKRQLQEYHRRQGLPKIFMINVFTAGIILAIEKSGFSISSLIIDIEYPGYETRIQRSIGSHFSNQFSILFSAIGKLSSAHYVAYGTYIGKRKPNNKATFQVLLKIINKKDRDL